MKPAVDYKKHYDMLYELGYHDMGKNHGRDYMAWVYKNFRDKFETILDVGCSNGQAVRLAYRNNKIGYGIDVSSIAIRYCYRDQIRNCIEGSVLDIPFKDNFFDAVFSCDVLEHLHPNDLDRGLDEMVRVTKKFMFIKVAGGPEENTEHIDKAKKVYGSQWHIDQLHITLMNLDEWKHKILSKGFELHKKNFKGMMAFVKK